MVSCLKIFISGLPRGRTENKGIQGLVDGPS
jgi:hypothetical protein